MYRISKLICGAVLFHSFALHAATVPDLLWDDAQGLVPATGCTPENTGGPLDIRVLDHDGMWNEQHISTNTLAGTLIKLRPDVPRYARDGVDLTAFEVIAAPMEADVNCDRIGKHKDIGYVTERHIHPLDKLEIVVKDVKGLNLGPQSVAMVGSLWRLATTGNDQQKIIFKCDKRQYTVFNVYADEKAKTPSLRVGVWKNQTEIFKNIDVRHLPEKPATSAKTATAKTMELVKGESKIPKRPLDSDSSYIGQTCSKTDKDAFKCLMCVMNAEANPGDYVGRLGVGRLVMERLKYGSYGKNFCEIAWGVGQFVALMKKDKLQLPKSSGDLEALVAVAREAKSLGGLGFLQFRTCGYISFGINIGGNCYFDDAKTHGQNQPRVSLEQMLHGRGVAVAMGLDTEPDHIDLVRTPTDDEIDGFTKIPPSLRGVL